MVNASRLKQMAIQMVVEVSDAYGLGAEESQKLNEDVASRIARKAPFIADSHEWDLYDIIYSYVLEWLQSPHRSEDEAKEQE